MIETKISRGYQTVVPSAIRKSLDIGVGDGLDWELVGEKAVLRPRREEPKKDPLLSLIGSMKLGKRASEEVDEVVYE